MKILWMCNLILPRIAEKIGLESSNKEGWITGLAEMVLANNNDNKIELSICFPVKKKNSKLTGEVDGFKYYSFYEKVDSPWKKTSGMEEELKEILQEVKPDLVHIFGTEYPHTLAMANAFPYPDKILVGIQGLCFEYAKWYMADLPERIQKRFLLRDLLKWDNLKIQQKHFYRRGEYEIQALNKITHVTGRTSFDKNSTLQVKKDRKYFFMNETLRPIFYKNEWSLGKCERGRLFATQGNYPIKGIHYLIEAIAELKDEYPELRLFIAGDPIIKRASFTEKIKISSYGKYIADLIEKNGLNERVKYLGSLNGVQMCEEYKKANMFISPSSIENSPNSVGEAMLLGMPVLSSDVGGVSTMLTGVKLYKEGDISILLNKENDFEGILYPHENVQLLAEGIRFVLEHPYEAAKMGKKAKCHALVTHSPEVNYHRLTDIYAQILEGAFI